MEVFTNFSGPTDADESTDTYDTIDWLVKNLPNNNGRVGIWGISYPGFFAAFGMIDAYDFFLKMGPLSKSNDKYFKNENAYWNANLEKPEPFVPNRTEKIEFVMPDAHHVFRPGYRIMVQIQSSWFPLTER